MRPALFYIAFTNFEIVAAQNEKTTLLGRDKKEYATILKWLSYFNQEVVEPLAHWFRPLVGTAPYNKKQVEEAEATVNKVLTHLEQVLLSCTFLVGHRVTLADIFAGAVLARGYTFVLDKEYQQKYPNVFRYFQTVINQPIFEGILDKKVCEERVKYTPPKKEQPKKEQPKKEQPKKAEDEDDVPKEKKAKHPLEDLGASKMPIDEWKRFYSNNDTKPTAMDWFWGHYDASDFSLWRVDYKYNDELTQVFMSSNLIGGFFNRLEASRKYLFGCLSVYGANNDSIITGAFLVRGQEALPAFDVAPDYESYEFKKLDPSNEADKEFVGDAWAWDKPIDGKDHADGKVFK